MAERKFLVRFYLTVDGDEGFDESLVEEAVTAIFDEVLHEHAQEGSTTCGLSFVDMTNCMVDEDR